MKAAVVSFFVFLFSISSHASIEMLGSGRPPYLVPDTSRVFRLQAA